MSTLLELDRPRKLRYDFNAIADIEERAGFGIGALFSEQRAGFHPVRLMIWAGLKWNDRSMTPDKAGALIMEYIKGGGTLEQLMDKVRQALQEGGVINFQEVEDEGNVEAETD